MKNVKRRLGLGEDTPYRERGYRGYAGVGLDLGFGTGAGIRIGIGVGLELIAGSRP